MNLPSNANTRNKVTALSFAVDSFDIGMFMIGYEVTGTQIDLS